MVYYFSFSSFGSLFSCLLLLLFSFIYHLLMIQFLLSHCICKSVKQMKNIEGNYVLLFLRAILATQQLFPKFLLDTVTGVLTKLLVYIRLFITH